MTGNMLSEISGSVGWMTFNNPDKRNAMSIEMWGQMGEILEDFARNDAVRVVVMRGAGERAFVSGADISQFEAHRSNAEAAARYSAISAEARRRLRTFEKPLIAMIHGYCLGGGLGIALAADLRFAADDAVFGIPAARLGIAYGPESMRQLVALVGPMMAKDMLFSARRLPAAEAQRIGLVSHLAPAGELEATVRDYAATLVENAPLSQRATKAIIDEMVKPESEQDAALAQRHVSLCFDSADYAEGRRAFMEKRKPVFTGR